MLVRVCVQCEGGGSGGAPGSDAETVTAGGRDGSEDAEGADAMWPPMGMALLRGTRLQGEGSEGAGGGQAPPAGGGHNPGSRSK